MRRPALRSIILISFLFLSVTNSLAGQDVFTVPRIRGKVILDGRSDEAAWKGIESLEMVMHMPAFGGPPTERTEILVAYDDAFFYAAGRLYVSDPGMIRVTSKKRDYLGGNSDWFGFIFDTFNDNENALGFFTTPAGLRMDLSVFNDAQGDMPINMSWNTFWDVEVECTEEGWFAEMRIPFSSLRFQERNGRVVMGLIAWRWIAAKNEQLTFPAISPKWGNWATWKPSQCREIVFEGIRSRNPLYVTPYGLGGYGASRDLNDAETAYDRYEEPEFEIGVDTKVSLTSNLTLDLTLNTDFAQVEADDQQVNLTRFSLFFPEKRLFFQERSSNFEFNMGEENRLFYSRRIGIHDEKPVRLYGGARLVGRAGPYDVGFMNMQTARMDDLPSENFGILRVRRQVFNPHSYAGGIVTSRIGMDGSYNVAYGIDGIFRVFGDDFFTVYVAQTLEDSLENDPLALEPTRFGMNWERRNLEGPGYEFSYSRTGEDFNPGMGFLMREDYTRYDGRLFYGWIPGERSASIRHMIFMNGFVASRNSGGITESVEWGTGWEFLWKSLWSGSVEAKVYYEDVPETFEIEGDVEVPVGRYTFFGLEGMVITPQGSRFYVQSLLTAGSFYDGARVAATLMPTWSLSSDLELSGYYQYSWVSFPEREQVLHAHIGRIKAQWTLSTAISFSAFLQYNSAADVLIGNLRFRYNPKEGNDFYLVYDEGLNMDRYAYDPVRPRSSNRTLLVKYSYTFLF